MQLTSDLDETQEENTSLSMPQPLYANDRRQATCNTNSTMAYFFPLLCMF